MGKVLIGTVHPPEPGGDEDASEVEDDLQAHIVSATPHPAYDDAMNLDIYFENGLS